MTACFCSTYYLFYGRRKARVLVAWKAMSCDGGRVWGGGVRRWEGWVPDIWKPNPFCYFMGDEKQGFLLPETRWVTMGAGEVRRGEGWVPDIWKPNPFCYCSSYYLFYGRRKARVRVAWKSMSYDRMSPMTVCYCFIYYLFYVRRKARVRVAWNSMSYDGGWGPGGYTDKK